MSGMKGLEYLFLVVSEQSVFLASLFGCLCDIQLSSIGRLMSGDPVGEVQLPGRRRKLRRLQEGLGRH
jgi:hypothetical protein